MQTNNASHLPSTYPENVFFFNAITLTTVLYGIFSTEPSPLYCVFVSVFSLKLPPKILVFFFFFFLR